MRLIAVAALLAISFAASAFEPRTGQWWNPNESGRGFNIDIQEGTMVVAVYTYDTAGNAQWYLAAGPMTNGQRNFTATLDKYRGGQCVTCNYSAASVTGNDGVISVAFTDETSATVTLPGGRTTTIQPINFGYGDSPQALLGEWIYTEDIVITFADRFNFTQLVPGTSNGAGGNSVAFDPIKAAGCELNVRGSDAGYVVCVDVDSKGETTNTYRYRFGLDQTFDGAWISPTGAQYAMKGWKTASRAGATKATIAVETIDNPLDAVKAKYDVTLPKTAGGSNFADLARAVRRSAGIER